MKTRRLGHSDLLVSSIGMGCVTFGREIDSVTSYAVMDYAFENGITLFDTAEAYAAGESERVVGTWVTSRKCREQIVLATKVNGRLTAERIINSVESSLQRLQTDRIDLLQMHVWDSNTPLEETFAALTKVVHQGKVRYVGCSNYSDSQLAAALNLSREQGLVRLASVQPPYNLVQREIEKELLPLCDREHLGVISYSPLAAGFLTGKYLPGKKVNPGTRFDVIPGHQAIYFTDHGYQVLKELQEQSTRTGKALVQCALEWVFRQPLLTSVLIGARSTAHIDQALLAASSVSAFECGECY